MTVVYASFEVQLHGLNIHQKSQLDALQDLIAETIRDSDAIATFRRPERYVSDTEAIVLEHAGEFDVEG